LHLTVIAPEQPHFSNTYDSYVTFDEPGGEFEPANLSLDCQKTSVTLDAGSVFSWPLEGRAFPGIVRGSD